MTVQTGRTIKVNFEKKCSVCKAMVEVGTYAVYDFNSKSLTHTECAIGSYSSESDPTRGNNTDPITDPESGYWEGEEMMEPVEAEGEGSGESEGSESGGSGEGSGEGQSESESEGESGEGESESEGEGEGQGEGEESESSESPEGEQEGEMENPFPEGTRRHEIIEEHKAGRDPRVTLMPKVENQVKPFVLTKRVEGLGSIPRPMEDKRDALTGKVTETGQKTEFKYECNRTIAAYEKAKEKGGESSEGSEKGTEEAQGGQETPSPQMKPNLAKQADHFVREMQRIRISLDDQAGEANVGRVDHVSYRPIQYGVRMILNEISPKAALFSFALHWPAEARRFHGISEYNPARDAGHVPDGEPTVLGYVRKLAKARVPIMLVGPAGAGKSRMAQKLAELDFNGSFASVPLTAGIMPSWLIGSHTVDGWKGRPFLDIYTQGGVFAFEEMDSADPNVLLIINNAIANGYLDNPHDGLRYEMHPDFQPVACCNTLGLGADRFYVGRERLDFATIDRFRMGRVLIGMDNDVDFAILQQEIDSYVKS